jgi:hypothetical protein
MVPKRGMGMRNWPMMAPETPAPSDVPVEMTNREIGTIFLCGVLIEIWILRAYLPNPSCVRNSPMIGISEMRLCMHPLLTAVSPNSCKYSLFM